MGFFSNLVPNELKGGGWVDFAGPAVGIATGNPWLAAGVGAAGSAYRGGNPFLGALQGYGAGEFGQTFGGGQGLYGMATGASGGGPGIMSLQDRWNKLYRGFVGPEIPSYDSYGSVGELAGPSAVEMGVPGATGYAAPYAASPELVGPSAVELGVPGATGYDAPYTTPPIPYRSDLYRAAMPPESAAAEPTNYAPVSDLTGGGGVGVRDASPLPVGGLPPPSAPSLWEELRRRALGAPTRGSLGRGTSALNLGSGLYGLYTAAQTRRLAAPGRAAADSLRMLAENPNAIRSYPGYQSGLDAGRQELERSLARQGQIGGGLAAEAMAKFGGAYDMQYRSAELQRLAQVTQGSVPAEVQANDIVRRALEQISYTFRRA